mgnify:CR=1 FL=1
MKRHIVASLITLLIVSAMVGLGYLIILYPKLSVDIFMYLILAAVVVFIYQLVLFYITKRRQ